MNDKDYFTCHVLHELLMKTKLINNQFKTNDNIDKSKRWRCHSCDQLCGYDIYRITLLTGVKVWDMNVKNL